MQTPNKKHLKLLDIVPGKLYVKNMSPNVAGFDLISFECSEIHGAQRGFVNLYYDDRKIFPNSLKDLSGYGLSVKVADHRGGSYSMPVSKDAQSNCLMLESKTVYPHPNLDTIRSDIEFMINIKEKEIASLRESYKLLELAE